MIGRGAWLVVRSLPTIKRGSIWPLTTPARASTKRQATSLLYSIDKNARDGSVPIALYALAYFQAQLGHASEYTALHAEAISASPDYCFPNRLEELIILQAAVASDPDDARAAYYLGNLLYDRRRHREAIAAWERSSQLDPSFSIVWRNLGIAYFNVLLDPELARPAFDKAIRANPRDARVLYERDQLAKRIGEAPERRLAELEKFPDAVHSRDDLTVELASLYNQTRQHHKALSTLFAGGSSSHGRAAKASRLASTCAHTWPWGAARWRCTIRRKRGACSRQHCIARRISARPLTFSPIKAISIICSARHLTQQAIRPQPGSVGNEPPAIAGTFRR